MRSHYWTCSKFADWLRGTKKLGAGTAEQWDDWTTTAQMKHSFRYWLAEEGLDYLQTVVYYIPDKLYSAKYYINNRWITKSHALTAHSRDVKPGAWCDVGNRFLPCLFNELVDFVEVELAWWHIAWADPTEKKKYKAPFWATGWFRWRTWRCPEAGLDHLDWAMTLTNKDWADPESPDYGQPTSQAVNAREIKALYLWWTTVYPNRPDPYEASGWSKYCELKRQEHGKTGLSFMKDSADPATKALGISALDTIQEMEAAYEAEDTEMMTRLIKIRGSLWT
jgi:hypothetical protein